MAIFNISDVDEDIFIEDYLEDHYTWDEDFQPISSLYEEIVEATKALDNYRTQRRLNRRKLVAFGPVPNQSNGYRTAQSYADHSNMMSNIGHGIFNIMAKGVTTVENTIKKEKIFKSKESTEIFLNAVLNLIFATREATLDIIKLKLKNKIKIYSESDERKSFAATKNIHAGRVQKAAIKKLLLEQIHIYPYNHEIYEIFLYFYGPDNGNLKKIVDYLNVDDFEEIKASVMWRHIHDEETLLEHNDDITASKKRLLEFCNKVQISDTNTVEEFIKEQAKLKITQMLSRAATNSYEECKEDLTTISQYANQIGHKDFAERESKEILRKVIENDFLKIINNYSIKNSRDLQIAIEEVKRYGNTYGYADTNSWAENYLRKKTKKDIFGLNVRQMDQPKNIDSSTPSDKNRILAALLALFLGGFGIHKFYLGQKIWGVVYLLFFWTFIPAIAAFIEGILLLVMSDEKFNSKFG